MKAYSPEKSNSFEMSSTAKNESLAAQVKPALRTADGAAGKVQTTFTGNISTTGQARFVNIRSEPADSQTVDVRPLFLRTPQNLYLLAEIRSTVVTLDDAVSEASHLLQDMKEAGTGSGIHESLLPRYSDLLNKQITKGETLVEKCQTKINKLVADCSDSCTEISQLEKHFSTCKKRFVIIKEGCKQFLPERNSDIPTSLLILGQITTSHHAFMDTEKENPVEHEDTTETSPTGLAELLPSGPPGQWEDSRDISTVPEDTSNLTNTNEELDDYTGIKELFVEPDEALSKF